MTLNDRFVILYLGIGFPTFLVLIAGILLFSAANDHLSFMQALECLQGIVPVCLTYVGAILGFAFSGRLPAFMDRRDRKHSLQQTVRVAVSLLLPSALMVFHLALTIMLVSGKTITLPDYKIGTAIIFWVLAGAVGVIMGKYF